MGQSHLNGEFRSFGGFKLSKELFDFHDFQPTGEDYEVESRLTHMIRKGVACQHQLNNGTISRKMGSGEIWCTSWGQLQNQAVGKHKIYKSKRCLCGFVIVKDS